MVVVAMQFAATRERIAKKNPGVGRQNPPG
jgi:hypothetical protein